MEVRRFTYVPGKSLKEGEKSSNGLYGIRSTSKGIILRITIFQQAAELMRDDSRQICEIFLQGV